MKSSNFKIFSLGGQEQKKNINWVSWSSICRSNKDGGLGVKHHGMFNLSLMRKFHWIFLVETHLIWYDLYNFRYGDWKSKIWILFLLPKLSVTLYGGGIYAFCLILVGYLAQSIIRQEMLKW